MTALRRWPEVGVVYSGKVVKTIDIGAPIVSAPTFANDSVYFQSLDPVLRFPDRKAGATCGVTALGNYRASVVYRVHLTDGTSIELHNPNDLPDVTKIATIDEPWIRATIMTPDDYLGNVLALCTEKRGEQENLTYVGSRAMAVMRFTTERWVTSTPFGLPVEPEV